MKATTHKGLEVELTFFEQDPNDERGLQEGWVCHKVEARVGEEVVGYLKIEYVPSATIDEKIPTIWHWWNGTNGQARHDDWEGVWFDAHYRTRSVPASLKGQLTDPWRLSRKSAPEMETILTDLQALEKLIGDRGWDNPWLEFEQFKRNHMDRPKVGYIYTEQPPPWEEGTDWRRKGIATLLYNEGAKWMARKGFPLWASTLQQDCATATWEAMVQSGYPIHERPVPWEPEKTTYVLDYTDDCRGHGPSPAKNRRLPDAEPDRAVGAANPA